MKPQIHLKKIWFDNDVIQLKVEVCDGISSFCNMVYIGMRSLGALIEELETFRKAIHGGICDVKFGNFGPEYGGGGFEARLHFYAPGHGKLYISTHQQSEYSSFKDTKVANEARFHLKTEAIQLDNFLAELKVLDAGNSKEAHMQCYTDS